MERRSIQNFEALAQNELRFDALSIAEAGYAAINTGAALARELHVEGDDLVLHDKHYPLAGRRVFFVGIGKCAIDGARAIEQILGEHLTSGIALDVSPIDEHNLKKVTPFIGTHPLPTETNEEATGHIVELLKTCTKDDLVITLISGGGSTLLCSHEQPMTCLDESYLFTALTDKGATIEELNTVRKHLSRARGGGIAQMAHPAEVLSLIVSDVPGNNIQFIASGPTVRDDSSVADAQAVLARYDVPVSDNIRLIETPKEEAYFERVTNILFLTNRDALEAMQKEAAQRGYTATVMSDHLSGEASAFATQVLADLADTPAKSVLLYAGETTVTLDGKSGKGGRNQEMALAAVEAVPSGSLVLPIASDGHDNSDHAGAIADALTRAHAVGHDLDIAHYLREHRSYDFFKTTGDALTTGYTGSNISDFIIALKQ